LPATILGLAEKLISNCYSFNCIEKICDLMQGFSLGYSKILAFNIAVLRTFVIHSTYLLLQILSMLCTLVDYFGSLMFAKYFIIKRQSHAIFVETRDPPEPR